VAKEQKKVHNPVYGEVSPLQQQLLNRASNRANIRQAVADLSMLGELDENILATVLQRSGSRVEQDAILEAIQAGRASRYGYGGGRGGKGSATPHFGAMPVDASELGDIVMESGGRQIIKRAGQPIRETAGEALPSLSQLMDEAEGMPSLAELQELSKRQAMQDEEYMKSRAGALQTAAGRTGPDAQIARQELGMPVSPGYENLISPEQDRYLRTRMSQESAQRAQIEKYAKQPSATPEQVAELWQQHDSQFPEFAGGQRPLTRAEQLDQMQRQELATYQQAVGDVPLIRDSKGQISVVPGFAEAQRARFDSVDAENKRLKGELQSRDDDYRRRADIIDAAYPEGGPEHTQERISLYKQVYGQQPQLQQAAPPPAPPEQGSTLPVNRQQMNMFQQKARSAGLPLVVDQADYDEVEPGAWYIDAETGEQVQKQPRGEQ
jgi:hypothetical protein